LLLIKNQRIKVDLHVDGNSAKIFESENFGEIVNFPQENFIHTLAPGVNDMLLFNIWGFA